MDVVAAAHRRATGDRYLEIDGRRWRRTDPAIDDDIRRRLVDELMSARRAVRDADGATARLAAARRRVHDAKVALGERGPRWWEPMTPTDVTERIDAATRALAADDRALIAEQLRLGGLDRCDE